MENKYVVIRDKFLSELSFWPQTKLDKLFTDLNEIISQMNSTNEIKSNYRDFLNIEHFKELFFHLEKEEIFTLVDSYFGHNSTSFYPIIVYNFAVYITRCRGVVRKLK